MRAVIIITASILAFGEVDSIQVWMNQAFYPALLFILVVASLGVPIPEDIPLIAAGVLLRTHPGVATWSGTIAVAMLGIMSGDLILYSLGRRWGREVVNHRGVRWLIPPRRFALFTERFHRHGARFCFFGRFFVGVRAAMCLTAGATRFPYWRFFVADFAGAVLSVPFFIALGYFFAGMIPTLRAYLGGVQIVMLAGLVGTLIVVAIVYRARRRRRARALAARRRNGVIQPPVSASSAVLHSPAEPAAAQQQPGVESEIGVG